MANWKKPPFWAPFFPIDVRKDERREHDEAPRQPDRPGAKWPRSAWSASAPASQRNAPPSTIKYLEAASRQVAEARDFQRIPER
jgi:hypothetical protein